jgi:hypothetical protein
MDQNLNRQLFLPGQNEHCMCVRMVAIILELAYEHPSFLVFCHPFGITVKKKNYEKIKDILNKTP